MKLQGKAKKKKTTTAKIEKEIVGGIFTDTHGFTNKFLLFGGLLFMLKSKLFYRKRQQSVCTFSDPNIPHNPYCMRLYMCLFDIEFT